jgi:hypothetical protein
MAETGRNWLRSAALILMIVATVFWLWFGIGSAYVERVGLMNWVMHILVPGGAFVLSTLLALRRPRIGGVLLAAEGLLALYFVWRNMAARGAYPLSTVVLMVLTLALPPLAAGVLFYVQARALGRPA